MTIPHFPPMTDEQSIRFSLTLPWAMGDNAEDGSVSYDAGEIETVLRFVDSLNARAEAAEAEIEAVHRYLDECFVNDPDEGQAVPLIDRVVLLVSRIARDGGEVEALREQVEWRKTQLEIANAATRRARDEAIIARADAIKLREQVATLEEATCSCCDRPVNRRIDAVICDYCYEDKLQ